MTTPTSKYRNADLEAACELQLFMENTESLYRLRICPAQKCLTKWAQRGKYDAEKARKLWFAVARDGAKLYATMFCSPSEWATVFTPATRHVVAEIMEENFRADELSSYLM